MEKLLDTKEIAEMLRMTPEAASRLMRRENIGRKIGKRWFVSESEWQEYIKAKEPHS